MTSIGASLIVALKLLLFPTPIAMLSALGATAAFITIASFGRSFLPELNEGSLDIGRVHHPT